MKTRDKLDQKTILLFNKRGGKVVKAAEGISGGMLMFFALQNVTKGRIGILIHNDDAQISDVFIGEEYGPGHIDLEKKQITEYLGEYVIDDQHINVPLIMDKVDSWKNNSKNA